MSVNPLLSSIIQIVKISFKFVVVSFSCFVLCFLVVFENFEFLRFGELGSVALHTKRRESKAKLII